MNFDLIFLLSLILPVVAMAKQIDLHPQFMKMRIVESGTSTFTTISIDTPIIIADSQAGSYVIEILKFYLWGNMPDVELETVKRLGFTLDLTRNVQSGLLQGDNDDLIFRFTRDTNMVTSGGIVNTNPKVYDVQDSNGKGILIADKQIHMAIQGDADSNASYTASIWALYRLTPIRTFDLLQELIG